MLKIGEQTINEIGTAITGVLLDHMPALDQAYKTCDKALTVGVSIKIEPCAEGNRCDIGLSFVTSKVKDHAVRLVNEMYEPMFRPDSKATFPDNYRDATPSIDVVQ